MRIKIDQPIKDFSGKPIELPNKDSLTFRVAIENSISYIDESHPMTGEKKLQAFQIGVKLNAKKLELYDLTVDQTAFVKERIGILYNPIVYGRFLELIGDENVKVKEEEVDEEPKKSK